MADVVFIIHDKVAVRQAEFLCSLFTDRYLSEMSHDAISAKKAICVLYGSCPNLPTWFTANYIHIPFGDTRGWNRLVHALNKFLSLWDTPDALQPRPN